MAIKFTLSNILQFYTFLSPIFISLFLLVKSSMDYNIKGIIYLVGLLANYIIGMLTKTIFFNYDISKPIKQFQRTPIKMGWPLHPGQTSKSMPDYCSVFEGPWFNNALSSTSMPSLNAMFHAFTFSYILMGVATNPNHPGIPFVLLLGITALTNMFYRHHLFCDKWIDIAVGIVLGAGIGVAYWFAISALNPTYTYYGKESNVKQCTLSKTKFRCSYN